jgi:thioredoxin reductase
VQFAQSASQHLEDEHVAREQERRDLRRRRGDSGAVGLRRGEDGHYRIGLTEGGEVASRSVIAASGARYRRLDVDHLERFEGVSVHYAATEVEAQRCEGEEVAVVGGELRWPGGIVPGGTHTQSLPPHKGSSPEQEHV